MPGTPNAAPPNTSDPMVAAPAGRLPTVRPAATGINRGRRERKRKTAGQPILASGTVTGEEFAQAVAALQDPDTTVVAPMTVAARGRRP